MWFRTSNVIKCIFITAIIWLFSILSTNASNEFDFRNFSNKYQQELEKRNISGHKACRLLWDSYWGFIVAGNSAVMISLADFLMFSIAPPRNRNESEEDSATFNKLHLIVHAIENTSPRDKNWQSYIDFADVVLDSKLMANSFSIDSSARQQYFSCLKNSPNNRCSAILTRTGKLLGFESYLELNKSKMQAKSTKTVHAKCKKILF